MTAAAPRYQLRIWAFQRLFCAGDVTAAGPPAASGATLPSPARRPGDVRSRYVDTMSAPRWAASCNSNPWSGRQGTFTACHHSFFPMLLHLLALQSGDISFYV